MNRQPLPPDIIERFGHLPDAVYRTGNEFSSACPQCGGGRGGHDLSDRFRMWERPGKASSFWCRRCGYQGFTDDNRPGKQMSEAEILELDELRRRESEREEKRLQAKIEELRREAYWQGWHDAMNEQQRQLWRDAGIPNEFQNYWQLGYNPVYRGSNFTSPAMTIPYFTNGWQAQTVQYRLLNPPAPSDKYRFQAGLKTTIWQADPDTEIKNAVILCEGMKKAAVTFIELVAKGNGRFCVVSVPSKAPGVDLMQMVSNADPLYIILDPDAFWGDKPSINRLAKMVSCPKRVVKIPVKADDFFTMYNGTAREFNAYLDIARPA